ncbi:FG-GAP-like repeat-containing protein [Hymenobacter sp. ASUV-10]|uniref:FG-GAP-like repeat-containing protein n=1 Tax=Hymenobacter aranciens TaxID=3063996 RepID=A0ABT9BLM9_9BACT|nr:FG-GAP-like repeat-containing protein [Hymenobacter sp. ASUV-10]MDO7877571.1 FG-GAP-like repeat-containing protein [Hymenobacter sp. ASUV-10]
MSTNYPLLRRKLAVLGGLLPLLWLAALAPAAGQSFSTALTSYAAGPNPLTVALVDVNADGWPDLLTSNGGGQNYVTLRLGTGVGTFATTYSTIPTDNGPTTLVVQDINADGRPDLITGQGPGASVSVLLADPATPGSFLARTTYATGSSNQDVELVDVNADGRLDLLAGNDAGVRVRLGDVNGAPGTFLATFTDYAGTATSLEVVDLNGDGRLDLVTADAANAVVRVRLASGAAGSFAGTVASYATSTLPRRLAVVDVNGDGRLDFVTAGQNSGLSVVLADAAGSYLPFALYGTGGSPVGLAVTDVNGDGRPDLLTSYSNTSQVGVRLAAYAPGSFSTVRKDYFTGHNAQQLLVADVNADGLPDLLTANYDGSNVGIRLGAPNAAPTALTLSNSSVAENGAANATVGTFTTTDPNNSAPYTYWLESGPGSTDNASFTISGNTLRLTAPADYETKSSYAIRVRTTDDGGASLVQTFTVAVTNVAEVPTLTALSPTSGPVGTSVTITGTDLANPTGLTLNGVAVPLASITANTGTSLTFTVPAGATSGPLVVTTSSGPSNGVTFTVTAFTITGIAPTSGPMGTPVTITGTNFTNVTGVSFNAGAATTYTVNSDTQITATVPPGATSGPVTVTTAAGTVSSSTAFVVTPQLSSLSLSAGALSPAFAPGTTSYSLTVPGTVTSTTVTPTNAQTSGGAITVNGITVASGSASGAIALNPGSNTITVIVNPDAGGAPALTYTVTVTRTPCAVTALARNVNVTLDASGTATVAASAVNNGSSSTCGPVSLSLDKTSFTCANVGANTVTLTVTDGQGGSNTATATVTVADNMAPTTLAQDVTLTLDATGTATLAVSAVDNGSRDNCGITTRSISRTSFSCADVNPATQPALRRGNIQFVSANKQYVLSNATINANTTGTLETWVKTTTTNARFGGLMNSSTNAADGGSGNYLALYWETGGRVAVEGMWNVVQTGALVTDGQWHHVAAVADGSTCKLYIDGVLNATGTVNAGQSLTRRIMLGSERSRLANYANPTMELDNSRVWSVARTAAQILDGKDNEVPTNTVGLQLAYAFNESTGSTTVRDGSGNNNTATLNGTSLPTFTTAGGALLVPPGQPVTLTVADATGNSGTATTYVKVVDNTAPTFITCGTGTSADPFVNLNCVSGVATGTYWFRIGGQTFQGYVDGTTDGGGWVEILNYLHQGGTNPALNARTSSLPVQTSAALGADESASATAWGHAAPALVASLNPQEVRFYGQSSAHSRVIHFKTSHAGTLNYLKTGSGDMSGIGASFTALPGHSANLPAAANTYYSNQGASAATEFPFYTFSAYHWGIKGFGSRWEADDYVNNPGSNTLHRIFVRGSATAAPGGNITVSAATGQCGAAVTLTGTQTVTDNCGTPTVTFSPASGSFFAVGTTSVTATATDAGGLQATRTFTVTVTDTQAPAFATCGAGTAANPFRGLSCAQGQATGTYWFRIGGQTFQGYVDGTTDGGGWVEILNYLHQGGTNPALNPRTSSLPVQTSAALGADESASATAWGHAAPALVASLNPQEVRFYGQSSAHVRVIHFKTSLPSVLNYLKTGTGDMSGLNASFTALPGHSANLPASANFYYGNNNNQAATEFPFFTSGAYHWGIKGFGNRWEADDYANNPANNTLHRIFVRGSVLPTTGLDVAATAATGQCGANVTLTGTQPVSDNCSAPTVSFSPASGSFFAVGSTPVTATATDASGNQSTVSFTVTVTDNTAPSAPLQLPAAPAAIRANVPEAAGYGLVYQLNIPNTASFNALAAVPYAVNNSATALAANPARVAYYMELTNGSTSKWVWASMDNFANNLTELGLPHPTTNPVTHVRNVSNLNVFASSNAAVTTGTNLGTGRLEMHRFDYAVANSSNVPGASNSTFDFGDAVDFNTPNYGSFQVHNVTNAQTVFAYNNWGRSSASASQQGDVGIGNQPSGHPDWTFSFNASTYTVKTLYILAAPGFTKPATVTLDENGTATLAATQVYAGNATDNCGTVTPTVSKTSFGCADLGTQTVSVMLSDGNGNTSAPQTAVVTVVAPPAASIPVVTWTGNAGTSWTDACNWSYGLVPTAASASISIPAGRSNYPVLSGASLTVGNLSIAAGASLSQGSTTLLVTGNLSNLNPAPFTGVVSLTGTGPQTVTSNFSTLVVNKASGTATLTAAASVSTALTMTSGTLKTGSYILTLSSTAMLTESATSYVNGRVQTTRDLNTAGTANTFGGLGLTLTPATGSTALPGSTLVQRTTGTARTGVSGRQGILRSFDIQPAVNTGLNVTLAFSYREAELNGIEESKLALFKSETGAADTWGRQRNVSFDATANTATLSGVRDFSIWTLGSADAPLPVELTTFTATAEGRVARLQWTTASEKNNAYFDVERSLDGREFSKIGQERGQGSKASPTSYTFLDKQLPAGTVYYRLRQVDLDGTASYSPVRTVTVTTGALAAALTIYPTEAVPGQPLRYAYSGPALPAGATLEVYDATGRCLHRQAAGSATGALEVKGLSAGWYWVRLRGTDGPQQARFYQP